MVNENDKSVDIIIWDNKYLTGIDVIDSQHKYLINLTNQLYKACCERSDGLSVTFQEAMRKMVNYVRFHFTAEMELQKFIKYPESSAHKKLHDDLIQKIIDASNDYKDGKKYTPNIFVRTLVDWILSHIAYHDKLYVYFITEQKNKGLLTDKMMEEIETTIS